LILALTVAADSGERPAPAAMGSLNGRDGKRLIEEVR